MGLTMIPLTRWLAYLESSCLTSRLADSLLLQRRHNVSDFIRGGVGPAGDIAEERIAEIGDEETYLPAASHLESAGGLVAHVAEFGDGGVHSGPGLCGLTFSGLLSVLLTVPTATPARSVTSRMEIVLLIAPLASDGSDDADGPERFTLPEAA